MSQEQSKTETNRIDHLERRLQILEDAEAIRNLKAVYAAFCDDNYDADGIAELFTEDAIWESPSLGRFEGREMIRDFFKSASSIFSFAIHYSLNGHIEVSGDNAKATWYLFMPCTLGSSNQAMWRAGIDRELYTRISGNWKYKHKSSEPLFNCTFDEGWAKQRFS